MPVLAAVVTLVRQEDGPLLARLGAEPDLLVGEPVDGRVPLVLDCPEALGVEARLREIRDLDGVLDLSIVWADLSDLHTPVAQVSP